jgi:hypothetical protein
MLEERDVMVEVSLLLFLFQYNDDQSYTPRVSLGNCMSVCHSPAAAWRVRHMGGGGIFPLLAPFQILALFQILAPFQSNLLTISTIWSSQNVLLFLAYNRG